MVGTLMKIVDTCCGYPMSSDIDDVTCGSGIDGDELLWCRYAGWHAAGEFSMAVVQANSFLEDANQIEPGHFGTFVGVYDGHSGPEAARYARDNLFQNFRRLIVEEGGMSLDVLQKEFLVTDKGFPSIIKKKLSIMPQLATVGACYLAGLICDGLLYVANLGDAYAVLGRFDRDNREAMPVQLTSEHCMP